MRRAQLRPMVGRAFVSWSCLMVGLARAPLAAQNPVPAPVPQAAEPAPPPPSARPVWTGSAGVGLAITSGNSDTSNLNVSLKGTFDPTGPNLATVDGLYLRGSNNGTIAINRFTINLRDEFALTDRAIVFGQVRYLRDTLKGIAYLVAPAAGLGYKLVRTDATMLGVDASVGGVWERDAGEAATNSGSVNLGQTFSHRISSNATITQQVSGIWKTTDVNDALYTFGGGIAAAITRKSTIKVEALETYKTRPPLPTFDKQDVALLTSLVYTF